MTFLEIRAMPTTVKEIPPGCVGVHESTTRAFHVARRVRDLLAKGTPSEVVLELMDLMEGQGAYPITSEENVCRELPR